MKNIREEFKKKLAGALKAKVLGEVEEKEILEIVERIESGEGKLEDGVFHWIDPDESWIQRTMLEREDFDVQNPQNFWEFKTIKNFKKLVGGEPEFDPIAWEETVKSLKLGKITYKNRTGKRMFKKFEKIEYRLY